MRRSCRDSSRVLEDEGHLAIHASTLHRNTRGLNNHLLRLLLLLHSRSTLTLLKSNRLDFSFLPTPLPAHKPFEDIFMLAV